MVAQTVKNLPEMQDTGVGSLCQKDALEKEIATYSLRKSLVAQRIKCLPAMWETWVRSLGQEDPLEKEMATHSSIPAWRIPWMEEPGRLQSMGSQSGTGLSDFTSIFLLGNPMDRRSLVGYISWGHKELDMTE